MTVAGPELDAARNMGEMKLVPIWPAKAWTAVWPICFSTERPLVWRVD
jgi:hypothetical protein